MENSRELYSCFPINQETVPKQKIHISPFFLPKPKKDLKVRPIASLGLYLRSTRLRACLGIEEVVIKAVGRILYVDQNLQNDHSI